VVTDKAKVFARFFTLVLACAFAAGGCSDNTGPENVGKVYRTADYMWRLPSPPLTYRKHADGAETIVRLSFEAAGDTLFVRHRINGADSTGTEVVMKCLVNRTPFEIASFSASTLFRRPRDTQIPAEIEVRYPEYLSLVTLANETTLTGTAADGVLRYDPGRNEWEETGLQDVKGIAFLKKDLNTPWPAVFAGTRTGSLFYSNDEGRSWTRIPTTIPAIGDFVVSGTVRLCAVDGGTRAYEIAAPFESPTNRVLDIGEPAAAIGGLPVGPSTFLYLGSASGRVRTYYIETDQIIPAGTDSTTFGGAITRIFSCKSSDYPVLLLVDGRSIYSAYMNNFAFITAHSAEIRDVAQDPTSSNLSMYLATDAGIWSWSNGTYTPEGLYGTDFHSVALSEDGFLYALQSDAVYRKPVGTQSWQAIEGRIERRVEAKPLIMLPAEVRVGMMWTAGKIAFVQQPDSEQVYLLTGRVQAHLEELLSSDRSKRYPDVLVVRYAVENGTGNPDPRLLCWKVYYARGVGPVLIEDFENGALLYRTELQ
jgi:hypothetical protein